MAPFNTGNKQRALRTALISHKQKPRNAAQRRRDWMSRISPAELSTVGPGRSRTRRAFAHRKDEI